MSKARQNVIKLNEWVSVKDFGAKGDGVTDDTVAIQAAINSLKPVSGSTPERGGEVFFPTGTYIVTATVETFSAIWLVGEGAGSVVKTTTAGVAQIFKLASVDGTGQYRYAGIKNLSFYTRNATWAIKSTAALVLNCEFNTILLDCTYGISLCDPNTYTQATTITEVVSVGPVEQILILTGNFNTVERIDKEAGTGTSTEPYVHITAPSRGTADGNTLRKILLEGGGSVNKVPLKFTNATGVLDEYWMEASTTNGYALDLDRSEIDFTNYSNLSTFALGKFKLRNNSILQMDYFNTQAEDLDWQPFVDADSGSNFYAKAVEGRRGNNVYKVATTGNIRFERYVNETMQRVSLPAGYSAQSFPNYASGQNLLINPSFEGGAYGWSISSADTPTFAASEVAQGLMFQCTTAGGFTWLQQVTISSGQIGQPLTLRYVAKVTGSGFLVPYIAGNAELDFNRVSNGQGWQTITVTYRPSTSGALTFGVWLASVSGSATLYLDEMSLCAGEEGLINPAKFGSFELTQKTFLCATAAPTTGTWKVGDRVFNSAPSIGQPKSWVCTVAGTPGTWTSEGNL